MRIRIRGPGGQSVIHLEDTASVGDLHLRISEATSISSFDIKYGYPPKAIDLDANPSTMQLAELGVKLDGEQLIVSQRVAAADDSKSSTPQAPAKLGLLGDDNSTITSATPSQSSPMSTPSSFSFTGVGETPPGTISSGPNPQAMPAGAQPRLALARKPAPTEPPELDLPSHASTLLLRIMPDDNSCLFRAFGSAFFGEMDNMTELRSIIAQNIQANPEVYPQVVLEQKPDDYCRWIQSEDAWGGAIELDILSKHFDIEICSIDVQTLRVDRFNEGRPSRCILVYSGIHYDVIALSPSDPPYTHAYAPPDFDTKIFEADDDLALERAVELCRILQERHYFTDTARFSIKCNVCGTDCVGEKGATEHAKQTGHYDFGEAG
ncbi:MAG: hypothetical protein LQ347_001103 [Umbilicaria vellea]|nr:MAG: hypothetical protein LQ347_001103 [Umbilicaria vellea]